LENLPASPRRCAWRSPGLLDQRDQPLLAHPLPPVRQHERSEVKLVLEELLAVYGRPRLCKDINVPTDGSLAIVYPAFVAV
jgi:hypothetical protein